MAESDIKEILNKCDHTLLSPGATWDEIKEAVADGIKYSVASVCIPPCFVKRAADYAAGRVKICTVIGFPNGYSTSKTKCFEAKEAAGNGADELDMVINIGLVKEKNFAALLEEIMAVKKVCGERILKVIIETCLLTEEEKKEMCRVVSESGAEYIKTSTGFGKAGASKEDILLFKKHIGDKVKIKASGGIASLEDADDFLSLGASRLGTSRIVGIAKMRENKISGAY